jgi:hypothetical protein
MQRLEQLGYAVARAAESLGHESTESLLAAVSALPAYETVVVQKSVLVPSETSVRGAGAEAANAAPVPPAPPETRETPAPSVVAGPLADTPPDAETEAVVDRVMAPVEDE